MAISTRVTGLKADEPDMAFISLLMAIGKMSADIISQNSGKAF